MRRPLCLAMLGFVAAVRVITWIKPLPVPSPPAEDGQRCTIVGTVRDIVSYTDMTTGRPIQLIFLKAAASDTSFDLQNNSEFSNSDHFNQPISNTTTEYKDAAQVICRLSSENLLPEVENRLPEIGSRVRYQGKARHFREATNPGEFDERAYYAGLGISMQLTDAVLTGKSRNYSAYRHFLYEIRCRAGDILETVFPEKEASVAKAMLLGEKKGIDRELKNLYQEAGIAHILAISGLHISLLGMGLYRLLTLRLSRKTASLLSSFVLISYLIMTGASPSAVRAVFMFFLYMLAGLAGRTYDMPTALSLAAVLLLVENPAYLSNSGFQLSFMAAAGAAVVIPRFSRMGSEAARAGGGIRYTPPAGPLKSKLIEGLRASFCISLTTLPVLLASFYEWNLFSVLLNVLVIPLMGVLMGGILLLVLTGGLFTGLGAAGGTLLSMMALPVRGIFLIYEKLCLLTQHLPGRWHAGMPHMWQILLFYAGLAVLLVLAEKIPKKAGWPLAAMLCLIFAVNPRGETQLTMLDVGQGDCIYIRTESGNHYLYDAGSTSRKDTGTWQVIPFLKYQGVDRLEAVFVSHWDEDHVNGLDAVFEWADQSGIPIGGLVLPGEGPDGDEPDKLLESARNHGIPVYRMIAGEELSDGNTSFLCLHPQKNGFYKDRNASSLVLKLCVKGDGEESAFTALLTGDVEAEGEMRMLEEEREAKNSMEAEHSMEAKNSREHLVGCDILKTAHHGSDTSTTEEFLDAAAPSLALISCGKNNSYGHPHKEVLQRFEERGIPVLITTDCGAVTIRSKNKKIKVQTFLDVD